LTELRESWRADQAIDVEFHGSAASLARYVEGAVDVAGFHIALDRRGGREILLSLLRPGRDAAIRFLHRTQGLILPRGNPQRVRTLRDVASRRLRFVNRQPGSGTRILLDRLLAADALPAERIAGYAVEEFTHAAVAATIASGRADAGFGLEAAAAAFGLAFVPVAQERYLFACRKRAANSASVARFRALLASPETRAVVDRLAGYALDAPGALAALERNASGEIVLR
jgi:putative molybdopterin biosynthesis protein